MEDNCLSFPKKKLSKNGNVLNRNICTQGVSTVSNVCSLEAKCLQYYHKCILNNLEQRAMLRILPANTNSKQSGQEYDGGWFQWLLVSKHSYSILRL